MANVTISIQDDTLKAARAYAKEHSISLNALIRKLLVKLVKRQTSGAWIDECFALMDSTDAHSQGNTWKRKDLYRV